MNNSSQKRNIKLCKSQLFFAILFSGWAFALPVVSGASEVTEEVAAHGSSAIIFLWIAILLIAAKSSSLIERFGQPSVLGELVIGVVFGNLSYLGFHFFEPIAIHPIITFLAELGAVILLFQTGLESNIGQMRRVGARALLVACVGVVTPFVLGAYLVGPWLLPGLTTNAYLFLGAALTATSVGITARIFRDLGKIKISEAQIVLGAAVIDDVLGLVILAVVSAIVTIGAISIGGVAWIITKAVLFLVGSIVLGRFLAPVLGKFFSRIHTGVGMKFTLALGFGLVLAYLAQEIGLAPIVGAFAAGLVLDPVHFRFFKDSGTISDIKEAMADVPPEMKEGFSRIIEHNAHRHVEELLDPIGHFLVPIFFVVTGMGVDLATFLQGKVLLVALGVTVAAFIGKIISGFVAGKVRKMIVGWAMVPRGEVGLIFAGIGKTLGVLSDELFTVIVIMVILSTLLVPPILTYLLKRGDPTAKQASSVAS